MGEGETDSGALRPDGVRRRGAPWLFGGLVLLLLTVLVSLQLFGLWEIFSPDTARDTLLLYALSTLNFVAFFLFSFIFIRSLLKLRRERRAALLGSKLKTRLVVYFIAVSLLPITAMALFSYMFFNRSLEKWFSFFPGDVVRQARLAEDEDARQQAEHLLEVTRAAAAALGRVPDGELGTALPALLRDGRIARAALLAGGDTLVVVVGDAQTPVTEEDFREALSKAPTAEGVINVETRGGAVRRGDRVGRPQPQTRRGAAAARRRKPRTSHRERADLRGLSAQPEEGACARRDDARPVDADAPLRRDVERDSSRARHRHAHPRAGRGGRRGRGRQPLAPRRDHRRRRAGRPRLGLQRDDGAARREPRPPRSQRRGAAREEPRARRAAPLHRDRPADASRPASSRSTRRTASRPSTPRRSRCSASNRRPRPRRRSPRSSAPATSTCSNVCSGARARAGRAAEQMELARGAAYEANGGAGANVNGGDGGRRARRAHGHGARPARGCGAARRRPRHRRSVGAARRAARRRVERGRAPPGARDQEPAHAHPTLGRAHRAQLPPPRGRG